MNKIKEKMRELKDAIEEAEQRELDAKNGKKEVDENFNKKGGAKTTLVSRINVVRSELVKIRERLAQANEKLEDASERSQRSEVRRKQLAETEVDDFEYTEEVGNAVKTAGTARTSAENSVADAERKVLVLETDVGRAEEKRKRFAARVDQLGDEVADVGEQIRTLKDKDVDASEREDVSQDKAKFLEAQLRQTLAQAESREREAVRLARSHEGLEEDIESWIEKLEMVKQESDKLNGILD